MPKEILFLVQELPKGGHKAHAVGYPISTQAQTLEEIERKAADAMRCHFAEGEMPQRIRLRVVEEEVIAILNSLNILNS